MKKMLIALTAVVLVLTMLCSQALASTGDLTVKAAKVYSNASMTDYVGTIPAYTALIVRSYDKFADVYINGQVFYISASALLHKDAPAKYTATLEKGTKVYRRATTDASAYSLKKDGTVKVCKVKGNWALVQSTGSKGVYAFVKVDKLTNIKANG